MIDPTLEKFEEKMLKQVSPLEVRSIELLDKATKQEVKDDTSLAQAVAVKKEINAHTKLIKDSRLSLTRPLDDMKKTIMEKESEILAPVEKAKTNIGEKILSYEEELERQRKAEYERVDAIERSLTVKTYELSTPAEVETKGKEIKEIFSKLSESDQSKPYLKMVFKQQIDSLVARKASLEEEERQRVERERLAKIAEEQSAEAAKLERERAAIEQQERELQADKERQQRELERQDLEAKAAVQRKADEAAEKSRPKSNIATVTEFEIVEPGLVERKYCSPDSVKIRQAIKDGVTDISGVRIFQTKKVR